MKGKNTAAIATRVPDDVYFAIKSMADTQGMTISEVLKLVIEKGLKAIESESKGGATPQNPAQRPESQTPPSEESPPVNPNGISQDRMKKQNRLVKMVSDKGWRITDFFIDWLKPKFGKGVLRELTDEELDEALRLFELVPARKKQ